jgi:predicted permease
MFQSDLASTLYLLLGSVFVLLLIACVNVSSLLLARAVNREHEFTVRASIGAPRIRLARLAFTESLLLALAAAPVALFFAYAGLKVVLRIIPQGTIPDEAVVGLNVPVLLISLGIALGTVLIFGLAPAWHSASPRLAAALGSVRSSGSRTQRRLLSGFVVTEIALSLALLMIAGLMIRSLIAVESAPISFAPDNTLLMRIPLGEQRYSTADSQIRFFREFLDRARQVPGVKSVTVDAAMPYIDLAGDHVQIAGQPLDRRIVSLHATGPDYLAISGSRMLQGHFLDERELNEQSHDMVVTENFARRYFGNELALGRVVHLPELSPGGVKLKDDAFTVVGVIADLPMAAYFQEEVPHVFIPYTVFPSVDTALISTSLPASDLANSMRRVVYSIDKDQPIADVMTFRQILDLYGYAEPRFALSLFGAFAAAALLLSLVGIYGVLSFVTSQRTQEIGIRMALGADRGKVMWMVLRQACVLALFGVAAGLPLAFFAGRFAKGELVHTSQYDPVALIAAICVLPLLAVAGTWLPARRAAAIDPVKALRAE